MTFNSETSKASDLDGGEDDADDDQIDDQANHANPERDRRHDEEDQGDDRKCLCPMVGAVAELAKHGQPRETTKEPDNEEDQGSGHVVGIVVGGGLRGRRLRHDVRLRDGLGLAVRLLVVSLGRWLLVALQQRLSFGLGLLLSHLMGSSGWLEKSQTS